MSYYISSSGEVALKNFQYNGGDNSIIYAFILKPLARNLVETCVPPSIAPNSITLFGLLWMIMSYAMISYYCPNFDDGYNSSSDGEDVNRFPYWIFLFNGVAMLIYQTLDNMDGVQARKTGSSSPLGLLFDHGCDAFNVILGSTNWICSVGVGSNNLWEISIMAFAPMVVFYVTTWEEYNTGKLVLPIVNGPTEGLLLGALQMFISAAYGVKYWHETTMWESLSPYILPLFPADLRDTAVNTTIRNLDLVLFATVVFGIREITIKITTICRSHGTSTLPSLLPMVTLSLLTFYIGTIIPGIMIRNPRLFLNLCSALFVEMATALMLNHMTHSIFNPFRWTLIPLIILCVWGPTMNEMKQDIFLYSYATGMFVYLAFKMRIIVHEICSVLKIWCFDIVSPYRTDNMIPNNMAKNGHAKTK